MKKMLTIALLFGVPTGGCIALSQILTRGFSISIVIVGVAAGLIGGLAFSLIMTTLAKRLYAKVSIDLDPSETALKEGGANHFKGKEGVGGKLVLTNKRMIFKSHNFNIQNHQEVLNIADIKRLEATKPMKLFSTGLTVQLNESVDHKFIVDNPQEWITAIEDQKRKVLQ